MVNDQSFLLPASKVWGKVMFSQAFVILSTGGVRIRACSWEGVCVQKGCVLMGVWTGGCVDRGERGNVWTGGCIPSRHTPPSINSHRSGRYVSYWNAFLCFVCCCSAQSYFSHCVNDPLIGWNFKEWQITLVSRIAKIKVSHTFKGMGH